MKNIYKLSLVAVAASLVLVNCSSGEDLVGGGDDDNSVNTPMTGQFVDTYVKGLGYTCIGYIAGVADQVTDTGFTNEKGEFTCSDKGELIEFSLGSYVIGRYQHSGFESDASPIVSPYNFDLGSEGAINLAQLLQTLDNHTIDGVLTIPENYTVLDNVDIALDNSDFDALMADALNVPALVSNEVAKAHLDETLASLRPETVPAPAPAPADTEALNSFVSGQEIAFSSEFESDMNAVFASDGYYEETSTEHFCNGSWTLVNPTTIHITCADEGATPTLDDEADLVFDGELKVGMTVDFDGNLVTVEGRALAVNPDAP